VGQCALSHDGKYLFFCLVGDMYWVDAGFLDGAAWQQASKWCRLLWYLFILAVAFRLTGERRSPGFD
jgi:hypothetical protein